MLFVGIQRPVELAAFLRGVAVKQALPEREAFRSSTEQGMTVLVSGIGVPPFNSIDRCLSNFINLSDPTLGSIRSFIAVRCSWS